PAPQSAVPADPEPLSDGLPFPADDPSEVTAELPVVRPDAEAPAPAGTPVPPDDVRPDEPAGSGLHGEYGHAPAQSGVDGFGDDPFGEESFGDGPFVEDGYRDDADAAVPAYAGADAPEEPSGASHRWQSRLALAALLPLGFAALAAAGPGHSLPGSSAQPAERSMAV